MKKSMYLLSFIMTIFSLFLICSNLFASEMDNRIEDSAKQSYVFKTYLQGDDINIQSTDGAVTLTGTVSEESHKPLARETVVSLPGVKSVVNTLEVRGVIPAANTDEWLINKVRFSLFFHRSVNAVETEVFAKDGVVTLRGKASSEAQKSLTAEYVKEVEGVRIVNNEMTVSPVAMKPGKETMGEKMDAVTESIDDASITALVKMTLLYHRSTRAVETTVETKNGVVELGGKAKNAAERDLASKLVSDVYGVKSVLNTMIIE